MKVVCEKCASTHEVTPPPWVLASGRSFRFRCSNCGHGQKVQPPTGIALPEEGLTGELTSASAEPEPAAPEATPVVGSPSEPVAPALDLSTYAKQFDQPEPQPPVEPPAPEAPTTEVPEPQVEVEPPVAQSPAPQTFEEPPAAEVPTPRPPEEQAPTADVPEPDVQPPVVETPEPQSAAPATEVQEEPLESSPSAEAPSSANREPADAPDAEPEAPASTESAPSAEVDSPAQVEEPQTPSVEGEISQEPSKIPEAPIATSEEGPEPSEAANFDAPTALNAGMDAPPPPSLPAPEPVVVNEETAEFRAPDPQNFTTAEEPTEVDVHASTESTPDASPDIAAPPAFEMPAPSFGIDEASAEPDVAEPEDEDELEDNVVSDDSPQLIAPINEAGPVMPPPRGDGDYILYQAGEYFDVADLATLQRWIIEKRVSEEAVLSLNGAPWIAIKDDTTLSTFFNAVARPAPQTQSDQSSHLPAPGPAYAVSGASPESAKPVDPDPTMESEYGAMGIALEDDGTQEDPFASFGMTEDGQPLADDEEDEEVFEEWPENYRGNRGNILLLLGAAAVIIAVTVGIMSSGEDSTSEVQPVPASTEQVDVAKAPSERAEAAIQSPGEGTSEDASEEKANTETPSVAETPPAPKAEPTPAPKAEPKPKPKPAPKPKPKPAPKPKASSGKSLKSLTSAGWNLVERNPSAARKNFEQALEISPNDFEANYGLGYALVKANSNDRAKRYLCKARSLSGSSQDRNEINAVLNQASISCD